MNPICYCQRNLIRSKNFDFVCKSCYKSISNPSEFFGCIDRQCRFKKITRSNYIICSACYHNGNATVLNRDSDGIDQVRFICQKISQAIDEISYVVIAPFHDIAIIVCAFRKIAIN